MIHLLLVRHGMTSWNALGRLQGQSDIALNETGRRQSAALAARLANEPFDAIYASDLQRAWYTAQAIAAAHHRPVYPEPCLREIHFGEWEGLTYAEIQQRDPQAAAAWQEDLLGFAPPGGETLAQLTTRVQAFVEQMKREHAEQTILLVAHGGPLQVLLCLALGLPSSMYWQFHLAPASLSRLALYPQGAIVNLLNDPCHLDAQEGIG